MPEPVALTMLVTEAVAAPLAENDTVAQEECVPLWQPLEEPEKEPLDELERD